MSRRRGVMSDRLKYELAQELGFYHKVKDGDWGNITTREAGSLVRAAIRRAEQVLAEQGTLPEQRG
ncbi:MAG: alpha/beta-type small acid-soluble spore protein [Firmicutes bacterium]|jgi:small acid-soluble spore protein F (minor alpha/beta-type SASP)|nr:alpha/beta-type small acid-soluble spore protein [Bacillota bacterium]